MAAAACEDRTRKKERTSHYRMQIKPRTRDKKLKKPQTKTKTGSLTYFLITSEIPMRCSG